MRSSIAITAIVATKPLLTFTIPAGLLVLNAPATLAQAAGGMCAAGSGTGFAKELKGNWYCSETQAITYSNFPGNGSYNKITRMDASTGQCDNVKYEYSGSLSPLNEEVCAFPP